MIFGKKKDAHGGLLFSPANGQVVPITEAPDKVFSEKVLGDGVAVILESSVIVSPASGKIINVADTFHAYGIETADGLELLVHVGIDTVKLSGKGFRCKVKDGQKIKKGDVLCEVDLDILLENNCFLHTPVIITNIEIAGGLTVKPGPALAGETVIIEYHL